MLMKNIKTRENEYELIRKYEHIPNAKNILHNLKLRVNCNRNIITGNEIVVI